MNNERPIIDYLEELPEPYRTEALKEARKCGWYTSRKVDNHALAKGIDLGVGQ